MRTNTTKGFVYDTTINGKTHTCLYKVACFTTEEKMNIALEKERMTTGLNLRIEEIDTW